jgi:hypothetical protein
MRIAVSLWIIAAALFAGVGCAGEAAPQTLAIDQGREWTAATRNDFYTRDQGSRIMPFSWMQALRQPNGKAFLDANLARYGYLPNPADLRGMPVGFTVASQDGIDTIGMTCAACHTREIMAEGAALRIDGGPAIVDFQGFLADLDTAVGSVLASDTAFAGFAATVLGHLPAADEQSALRQAVANWYGPYHALMQAALPTPPWGLGRLDAVAMIFNRVTGLDIGPPPDFLIVSNIHKATAPVRYPFLWNAYRQDQTQWPGFADNGNDILGLSRNLGEVYGVFAVFHPQKNGPLVDFIKTNSAHFEGLAALEHLIKKIGPPKWPWPVNPTLEAQGKLVFNRSAAQGGCVECHRITPGKIRLPVLLTWKTPIQDVGTDSREHDLLNWTVQTGALEGAEIPGLTKKLLPVDTAFNVLATSVIGSILESPFKIAADAARPIRPTMTLTPRTQALAGAFKTPPTPAAAPSFPYESRVLAGIWAAAPYLHNGSVPTLAELLKPAAERAASFQVGPDYDIVNVGLAARQTRFNATMNTTDCASRDSGNSRCGHEFGTTQLSLSEKQALLEYLKTL